MTDWFSSDWHLGHEMINELAGRPFTDTQSMNQAILDAVNTFCAPDDTLYLLGDIVMGQMAQNLPLLEQVNCQLVLVHCKGDAGNHDRTSDVYPQKPGRVTTWRAAYEAVGVRLLFSPDPYYQWADGQTARMNHYPYDGDTGYENRHQELRPPNDGRWLLHGHTHGQWRQRGKMIDVGVDAWAGIPVRADTILSMIQLGTAQLDALPWV